MKKLIALLLMLPSLALADVHMAKYGVERAFDFWLYNADGTLDVDEIDSGTEVELTCAGGTPTTATNDFVDHGQNYSITLTAAELQCSRIAVNILATVADGFKIETYGHASSQHPDLDVAALQSDVTDLKTGSLSSFLYCEVNDANTVSDNNSFACILTDLDGSPVTQASGDLEGLQMVVTSGDQIREARYITDTTWDAVNSELEIEVSRTLPGSLADGVIVIIH